MKKWEHYALKVAQKNNTIQSSNLTCRLLSQGTESRVSQRYLSSSALFTVKRWERCKCGMYMKWMYYSTF